MDNYLALMALLVAGYLLKYLPAFPRDTATSLNLFVIYVALPALVLHRVPSLELASKDFLDVTILVALPWAMMAVSAALVLMLSRAFQWDRQVTGSLLLVVPMGNTSFLGIPMVTSFFGSENVPYALLYDQFGSFLILTTYGAWVLAAYGSGQRPSAPVLIKKVLTFPPFIALAIALMTGSMQYPEYLRSALGLVAASLVPVVMVAIGFQLRLVISRDFLRPLGFGLFIKLMLAPMMALMFCRLAGAGGTGAAVGVFEAGMPPMVTAGALAIIGGLATDLTAAMVGYGLVLSFVTLPFVYQLIMRLL